MSTAFVLLLLQVGRQFLRIRRGCSRGAGPRGLGFFGKKSVQKFPVARKFDALEPILLGGLCLCFDLAFASAMPSCAAHELAWLVNEFAVQMPAPHAGEYDGAGLLKR